MLCLGYAGSEGYFCFVAALSIPFFIYCMRGMHGMRVSLGLQCYFVMGYTGYAGYGSPCGIRGKKDIYAL